MDKVSRERVRVRYQDSDPEQAVGSLLDEVRNSLRDIMLDEGILSEKPFEDQCLVDASLEDIDASREIISPGRLHRAISVADLYKKHESHAVNPRIARAMYQVKYIETMGTGLTDLLDVCKANGLKTPLLEEVPSGFRIVIWRPERADNRGGGQCAEK